MRVNLGVRLAAMIRRVRLAAIGLSIVLVVCLWAFRRDDDPVYNGRSLSAWLDQRIKRADGTEGLSDPAIDAVQDLGPDVIPQLLKWLQRTDPPGFQQLRYGASIPVPLNDAWRTRAFLGFRALGSSGAWAIPELVDLTLHAADADVRGAAINSLTYGHPEIDRLLSQALRNSDVQTRRRAVFALASLRPRADLDVLLTAAQDDVDLEVRRVAIRALGSYSGPLLPSSTLKILRQLTFDPNGEISSAAQSAIDQQTEYRRMVLGAAGSE